MPDPRGHASTEQLADLLEGLLPDAEAEAVAVHLQGCTECAAVRDRLRTVPALLAATPVPPMPAGLAERLDQTVAAESRRRVLVAGLREDDADADADSSGDAVVVPLRRLHRDRVRHWLAGAATAAAVLVAISIADDVVGGLDGGEGDAATAEDAAVSGSAGSGSEGSAGSGSGESAGSGSGDALSHGSPEAGAFAAGLRALPDVESGDFANDVELLSDSGSAAFRLSPAPPPRTSSDGSGPDDEADAPEEDRVTAARGLDQLAAQARCRAAPLRSADVRGDLGSLVRVDGEVARLVASGPGSRRTVAAYSCGSGDLLARAVVDLGR